MPKATLISVGRSPMDPGRELLNNSSFACIDADEVITLWEHETGQDFNDAFPSKSRRCFQFYNSPGALD